MSDSKYSGTGADWTQLLTDPSLVSHLGELLQIYREAPPEKRDQALLEAMRNIKGNTGKEPSAPKAAASEPARATCFSDSVRTCFARQDQSGCQSSV